MFCPFWTSEHGGDRQITAERHQEVAEEKNLIGGKITKAVGNRSTAAIGGARRRATGGKKGDWREIIGG